MSFLSILNPFRKPSAPPSPVASPIIGPVASPTASDARCDSEGFYQHLGECWNDSIQMIFLFSDGLKEIVQPALLDPNFDSKMESIINHADNKDLFLFKSDLKGLKTTNLGAVNNPFANNSSKTILESKARERKNAIIEYFKVLKKRFMRHYTNEHLRRDSVCDTESAKDHSMFQTMSQISRAAGQDGISAAALGHVNTRGVNRSNINIEELRKKRKEKQYSPGGGSTDEKYLFKLYNLVFFDKYEFKYNVFNLPFKNIGVFSIPLLLSDISIDLIQNSKAVYIGSYIIDKRKRIEGHATAFYTCGGSQIYYDDNTGIYSFPWKEFFLNAVELYEKDQTTELICGNNTENSNRLEIQESEYYPIIRTGGYEYNELFDNEVNSYKYYTFIDDSLLLESKDGHFEYNGVSVNVTNTNLRKIEDLVFMTINNDQSVNTQRFNHIARHGDFNLDYLLILIKEPNPNYERILIMINQYIKSNVFDKKSLKILFNLTPKKNPEFNKKLLEIAEAHLDLTDVEELRKSFLSLNFNLPLPPQPQTPQPQTPQPNQVSKGGYRKRKTRYQKRLIKRKTQKKRRSRR
jgi:hypothetical protein